MSSKGINENSEISNGITIEPMGNNFDEFNNNDNIEGKRNINDKVDLEFATLEEQYNKKNQDVVEKDNFDDPNNNNTFEKILMESGVTRCQNQDIDQLDEETPTRTESHHSNTRKKHKKHHRKGKSKKKLGYLTGALLIFTAILVFSGIYVWKIWNSVETTVEKIQVPRAQTHKQTRTEPVIISNKDPFSVLLLGIDTGEYGRTEKGRSDIMVVATVNPHTETITLTSIPRDSYTEIIGKGIKDKINHAYAFGGVGMSANTVQNLLGIPIDYTVSADMKGFKEIIDAVGGIKVTPPLSFNQGGFDFIKGQETQMHGTMALEYIRNRYDTGGDYGRQMRARQVVLGVVESAVEIDSLINYQSILDSLSGNVKVDMTTDEMMKLITDYRSAVKNIKEFQLKGESQKIDGIFYEIISNESLKEVKQSLISELEIE